MALGTTSTSGFDIWGPAASRRAPRCGRQKAKICTRQSARLAREKGRAVAEQYDVIVVGAGFGGAASAALLAKHGLKTLLLDKNAQPGGKAVTISKEGFRYELWPIVGGPSLNSQFASVLEEIDMADEVELLAPETPISALLYKGRSGRYEQLIGSARPREQADAAGLISWLQLEAEDLPGLTRLLQDMARRPRRSTLSTT